MYLSSNSPKISCTYLVTVLKYPPIYMYPWMLLFFQRKTIIFPNNRKGHCEQRYGQVIWYSIFEYTVWHQMVEEFRLFRFRFGLSKTFISNSWKTLNVITAYIKICWRFVNFDILHKTKNVFERNLYCLFEICISKCHFLSFNAFVQAEYKTIWSFRFLQNVKLKYDR